MSKKTFKILGMHCSSCAMSIEWELEDQGIIAKCDYAKQILEVETELEESYKVIKSSVEKLGYKIQD